jgi:ABC-type bacteriocin/lantibiotic exporter with double-glycine peptidase domain
MEPATPPFLPQETDFSCAVACLRMVLASFGVTKSEDELRSLCDCTIFGAAAIELVRVARTLGFAASRKYSLTLQDLRELTEQGHYPIVYVVAFAGGTSPDVHSLIVILVTDAEINVIDPKYGSCALSIEEFNGMWTPMNNLAIVIA